MDSTKNIKDTRAIGTFESLCEPNVFGRSLGYNPHNRCDRDVRACGCKKHLSDDSSIAV